MNAYDPQKDAHDSYYAAIEAKRLRGDAAIRKEVQIGDCRLILGDCLEILPTLGKVDAVVTDPPYGIGASRMNLGKWRTSRMAKGGWDDVAPELAPFLALNVPTIIWGANNFTLPASRAFLIWNKGAGFKGRDFAECEQAWCSFDGNARVFDFDPLARGSYKEKQHPTQKPIPLMEWCLSFVPDAETVLDPFMGSGSTGVACKKSGRKFIGIEINEQYFKFACDRLRDPGMFIERPPEPKQEALFG